MILPVPALTTGSSSGMKKIVKRPSSRRTWKSVTRSLRNDIQQYCETTTLHGFRYITCDQVTRAGNLIWLLICVVSSILSIYLMLTVWNKYTTTPAVISVESTAYSLHGFPFPAVTICNFNKVYKPRADEMAKQMSLYGLNNSEIQSLFDFLPLMIHEKFSKKDFKHCMMTLQRVGLGPESLMFNLMQPCDKLIVECAWLGTSYDCKQIFKTVKTAQGFCCSFNYHVQLGEFPFEGFKAMQAINFGNSTAQPGIHEPLVVAGGGYDSGLSLLINVEPRTYRAPIRSYYGASVIIHDPIIFPEINVMSRVVQPGQDLTVHVKGSLIESEQSIRALNRNKRKCWFVDEVRLNSSAEYRYESCITECRMEYIYANCQCLPFYYPKTIERAPICQLADVQCVKKHRVKLSAFEIPYTYDAPGSAVPQCRHQCLPECSDKTYSLTMESAYFMPEGDNNDFLTKKTYFETSNESAVSIFFPDITCLKYRRETVMTWENVIAACGGIFGLCIGGSFVSLLELIYFLANQVCGPRKTLPSADKLPNHGRSYGQTTSLETKLRIEAKNYDFVRRFNLNKRNNSKPRDPLNFPNNEVKNMAFTIDLLGQRNSVD